MDISTPSVDSVTTPGGSIKRAVLHFAQVRHRQHGTSFRFAGLANDCRGKWPALLGVHDDRGQVETNKNRNVDQSAFVTTIVWTNHWTRITTNRLSVALLSIWKSPMKDTLSAVLVSVHIISKFLILENLLRYPVSLKYRRSCYLKKHLPLKVLIHKKTFQIF